VVVLHLQTLEDAAQALLDMILALLGAYELEVGDPAIWNGGPNALLQVISYRRRIRKARLHVEDMEELNGYVLVLQMFPTDV
jgi:hypothetical protein